MTHCHDQWVVTWVTKWSVTRLRESLMTPDPVLTFEDTWHWTNTRFRTRVWHVWENRQGESIARDTKARTFIFCNRPSLCFTHLPRSFFNWWAEILTALSEPDLHIYLEMSSRILNGLKVIPPPSPSCHIIIKGLLVLTFSPLMDTMIRTS